MVGVFPSQTFRAAVSSALSERDPLVREVLLASLGHFIEGDGELEAMFRDMVDPNTRPNPNTRQHG